MKKKKQPVKVKPPKNTQEVESVESIPFHLTFPFHLKHKDRDGLKDCFFKDEIDLKKYIIRYKLKKAQCKIEPTKPR